MAESTSLPCATVKDIPLSLTVAHQVKDKLFQIWSVASRITICNCN
ncbi:hypothetical protein RintRC_7593 [Richelia intracellularis]|nr:hypothetical protein RintRC_7593 [Richelia intracellularis]